MLWNLKHSYVLGYPAIWYTKNSRNYAHARVLQSDWLKLEMAISPLFFDEMLWNSKHNHSLGYPTMRYRKKSWNHAHARVLQSDWLKLNMAITFTSFDEMLSNSLHKYILIVLIIWHCQIRRNSRACTCALLWLAETKISISFLFLVIIFRNF